MRSRFAALGCALAFAAATGIVRAAAQEHLAVPQMADPPLDPNAPAAGWSQAAALDLPWDAVRSRPASEPTKAWIASDGRALYVRFDAVQHEPIVAVQHTNDVGQGSDDEVWIDLWPNGTSGYFYQFIRRPTVRTISSRRRTPDTRPTGKRKARRMRAATP